MNLIHDDDQVACSNFNPLEISNDFFFIYYKVFEWLTHQFDPYTMIVVQTFDIHHTDWHDRILVDGDSQFHKNSTKSCSYKISFIFHSMTRNSAEMNLILINDTFPFLRLSPTADGVKLKLSALNDRATGVKVFFGWRLASVRWGQKHFFNTTT